jgi:hypothetical protein
VANQVNEKAPASSHDTQSEYGKVDDGKTRDIMTEVGRSKGQQNNSGDFGNGNDGETGAGRGDEGTLTVAKKSAKERAGAAARARPDADEEYPA